MLQQKVTFMLSTDRSTPRNCKDVFLKPRIFPPARPASSLLPWVRYLCENLTASVTFEPVAICSGYVPGIATGANHPHIYSPARRDIKDSKGGGQSVGAPDNEAAYRVVRAGNLEPRAIMAQIGFLRPLIGSRISLNWC